MKIIYVIKFWTIIPYPRGGNYGKGIFCSILEYRHFKGNRTRTGKVIDYLKLQKPDVIGIYEVEGSTVFDELTKQFPKYTFQITEGPQSQEILVGLNSTLSVFITQKMEFKSGTTHMRPGEPPQ